MAVTEPGTAIVSSGSIPAHSDIQTYQRQASVEAQTSAPNFVAATSSLALTPTALGELGSTMALNAGIQMAKMSGQKLGSNPEGDLLPPITAVDKAFVESYSAQAEATLGNQAQQLMSQAQEEASKAYTLTPGVISSYQKNVSEGLQGILQHAPSTVRGQMETQFQSQLLRSSHQMNMSMISQNKERAQSEAAVYNAHQLQQMHDAALSGNADLAKQIYESTIQATKANAATGMLSPSQADTQLTSAKLNYYSSLEIKKAIDARNGHELEGFLAGMVNNKPPSLSWGEWEDVRNKTVAYVGAIENLDNRDQSLIVSQATAQAQLSPLTPDYIEKLRSQLTPTRFNNFMSSYISKQKTQYASRQAASTLQANWTDPRVMGAAKPDAINQAFLGMVQATKVNAQQRGIQLSDDDAQLEAASTAGSPIPLYVNKLNKGLQSGNPQLMLRDWQDYTALKKQGGQLTQGVTKDSIAMGTMFNHFLEEGRTPEQAAQMAQETVMNKSEETQKNNERLIGDWRKKTVKDGTSRDNWARKIAGVSRGTFISNGNGFALHMQNIMEDNLQYTNGNVEAAQQMLQDSVQQYWGVTNVNGKDEFTYMPVEKVVGLDSGAAPLIKQDMVTQLDRNFAQGKEAYDKGFMPYYMRIKNRPSYEAYLEAKNEIRQKQSIPEIGKAIFKGQSPDLGKQFAIVEEFEKAAPVEVEMVHRGGEVETYKLNITSSPLMQQSMGDTPIIGDYDITMSDDKGINYPIPGARIGPVTHSVYRPNVQWIKDNYFAVNGVNPEAEKIRALMKAKAEDELPHGFMEAFGRSAR